MRQYSHPNAGRQPKTRTRQPPARESRRLLHCRGQTFLRYRTLLGVAQPNLARVDFRTPHAGQKSYRGGRSSAGSGGGGSQDATAGNHGDLERTEGIGGALPVSRVPQFEASRDSLERHMGMEDGTLSASGLGSRRTSDVCRWETRFRPGMGGRSSHPVAR